MIKQETIYVCDACGKQETDADIQRRKDASRSYTHKDVEQWRTIKAGYRADASFVHHKFEVCSWACAKEIHARLAEITFDRKTAENEAKVVQWALEQAGVKVEELRSKTETIESLEQQVRTLSLRCSNHEHFVNENARLLGHIRELTESLERARQFGREELADLLNTAIRRAGKCVS